MEKKGNNNELLSYQFLRGEVPTRLCHTIIELEAIPGPLLQQTAIREVASLYRKSFEELLDFPTATEISKMSHSKIQNYLLNFTKLLNKFHQRHANVVSTMALGILQLKQSGEVSFEDLLNLREFLDRFYMSRIGLRTHIEHHLNLYSRYPSTASSTYSPTSSFTSTLDSAFKHKYSSTNSTEDEYFGVFHNRCDLKLLFENVASYVSSICKFTYTIAPKVEIITENGDNPITSYPSAHLFYIGTEILKNSMRAVIETHGYSDALPEITVRIIEKDGTITIKISDLGGGIPLDTQPKLFSYAFSTAAMPSTHAEPEGVFAGFGYGLALSRLYALYLGGRLTIAPVYGYGTDVFIYLQNPKIAREVLPSLDRATLKRYQESDRIPDHRHWMEFCQILDIF